MRVELTGEPRPRKFQITYDDVPLTEGRDWIMTSEGVTILVFKDDEPRLKGLSIDFKNGEFLFDERAGTSPQ
jgi:Fe-S cluster assembly iron-binding protein IscA